MSSTGSTAQQKARELDVQAVAQAKAGKLAAAIPLWGEALRQNPDDVEVLVHLGHALAAAGEAQKAEELATRAAKLAPSSAPPWFLLGLLAKQAKKLDVALESFALAERHATADEKTDVAVARAEILVVAGKLAEAEDALRGVKADRAAVCLVRAYLLTAARDLDGARAMLVRAGELEPLNPEPFKRLAQLVREIDVNMARELAKHAALLAPHDAEAKALVKELGG